MRILYFTRTYTPHDFRFLSALSRSRNDVWYLPYEMESQVKESRFLPEGVEMIRWRGASRWWLLPRLRADLLEVIDRVRPDVVHAGPVQKGAFLTALAGIRPLVTMSWGSDILLDARHGFGRWQAGYTLKRSSVFLCDCNTVRIQAQALGMPEERIVVFPWGVDLQHFSTEHRGTIRQELGWQDSFVFLSTRTMEPVYGVDCTIEAFISAARHKKDIKLLLLGDGSMRPALEKRIREQGLQDQTYFGGQIGFDKLPEYYHAADCYISSSYSDGSSISLLEAMACGMPVLVSDIPGNMEWVTPELNGWTFPAGSSDGLAQSMLEVYYSDTKLALFGEQSRQIAEERANWEHNVRNLFEAYTMARAVEQ